MPCRGKPLQPQPNLLEAAEKVVAANDPWPGLREDKLYCVPVHAVADIICALQEILACPRKCNCPKLSER